MDALSELLSNLKEECSRFPDKRSGTGNARYTMADIGMSAFSLFFMQSESFLAYQRALDEGQGSSNCRTLFGMEKIPTDNHIRSMLDDVHPSCLQPCFDHALSVLRGRGGLKAFERLGGRIPVALDGTEYFCSQKLGCPHCLTRKRKNGQTERYHAMLAATIVAPGHNMAFPLMPEFIAPQDGAAKQDCERVACKRWLKEHGGRLGELRPVYLGDDLFACQPLAEAVLSSGGDFVFVCKEDSHKTLYEYVRGAEMQTRAVTEKRGGRRLTYHYRWMEDVPLRDGKDALRVNWIAVRITDGKGKTTYDGAFVTSLPVTKENAAEIAACGRARWKVENESFNVLKNNGYHLEHNFGHGKKYLAMLLAAMNMLAFAFHTVCDCIDDLWQQGRQAKGSRKRFFEHLRTLCAYIVFPSWKILMETIISSRPPPELLENIAG
jgi:hypothetical protein